MRPFVGCWVSEWVHQWVSASVALCFVDTIQTTLFARSLSNFTCKLWTMRGGTYWFWVTGSKVKVNFCTLYIRPCGQDTDYSFSPITFKLHMSLVDDKGRNPIDFGSQGKRSSSILPTCEGMPRFALSSYVCSQCGYSSIKHLYTFYQTLAGTCKPNSIPDVIHP